MLHKHLTKGKGTQLDAKHKQPLIAKDEEERSWMLPHNCINPLIAKAKSGIKRRCDSVKKSLIAFILILCLS